MIDYSMYNLAEMRAIVTVLDDLTDEMCMVEGHEQDFHMAVSEFMRAVNRENQLMAQMASEAEPVPAAPPAEEPDDLQALMDTLSRCSDHLVALALAEDKRFAESGQTNAFIKLTVLRNANRSIIDMLANIRDHYDGLH